MRYRLILIFTVLSLVAVGCGPQPDKDASADAKAKVVEAYTVKKQTNPIILSVSGIVEAKREVPLSFGTSGKIVSIAVQKGSSVNQGQVLAGLDTSYLQSALAAASGQIHSASVQKQQTLRGASSESIAQKRLQVQSALQDLDKAKKDLAQGEILYQAEAITQNQYNDLKLQLKKAEIDLKNQQIALDQLLKGAEPDELARVDASISQAASEAARARQSLKDANLVAPFAGTIVEVNQQVGELTNPGTKVLQLVDLSEVKVKINVTGDVVNQYKLGGKVQIVADSGVKTIGTVTFISPVIDEKTGKYQVEVTAANPTRELRGGMIAAVEIPRKLTGMVVPLESVGLNQTKRYVLAIENGVIKKRDVQVGQVMEDSIEILSGVKPGDKLVKSGITYFVDGEKVEAKGE